ncbi:SMP-30/Gluconolaconase/LRE-like region family protein [Mycolicibacterium hassiacum DSM 44199]|uniref:SMP-30/Gluconolaconase/LRE-like region family protein n=1 Tax=Mycolicibacterium hassiacum (strain DSM 44199 / CIP 105218 / JCM 12690 / 3849) TaxID=1122247 RepID=K5BJ41_MYCHD|nr:SMP-30/gluconolactonase/LRE family protein [Mycolicibacterium hassiacum]EKF22454.1 SMP-30/Gluconolaconase/LRE-like region family protein [Mycolicibacterium hassiacum DSM 44199]MDA4084855.1 gluconolactonase [Mycolicibacterium hassiacum DSM 44199]VCT91685.1 6-deoxy-6-sulfogluconolactonase [Mycolicibacterium hassiacum DSM 44199]
MGTSVTPLVDGLAFPEAPRWRDGRLWFSDMIGKRVCTATTDGAVDTVATFDEMPGGLGFLPDGTPLVVGMDSGRLYALNSDVRIHAELRGVAGGHLDDMVVAADGTAYIGAVGEMSPDSGNTAQGTIVRVGADGAVGVEADGLAFPNGMVLAEDGRVLLVNETFAERITAFDIGADGALSDRRVWAELPGMHPDGLAIDADGAVWVGCYAEEKFVRVTAGGGITDTIPTPGRWAVAVELGGDDGRTLFLLTARTDIERFFRGDSHGRIDTACADVPRP